MSGSRVRLVCVSSPQRYTSARAAPFRSASSRNEGRNTTNRRARGSPVLFSSCGSSGLRRLQRDLTEIIKHRRHYHLYGAPQGQQEHESSPRAHGLRVSRRRLLLPEEPRCISRRCRINPYRTARRTRRARRNSARQVFLIPTSFGPCYIDLFPVVMYLQRKSEQQIVPGKHGDRYHHVPPRLRGSARYKRSPTPTSTSSGQQGRLSASPHSCPVS
jgi:hypothetical protein